MNVNLLKYEMETIINYNAEQRQAELYTRDKSVMRKLDRLVEECPEVYSLKVQETNRGETWGKTYIISDKKYISFRKPKQFTESQRKAIAERLAAKRNRT